MTRATLKLPTRLILAAVSLFTLPSAGSTAPIAACSPGEEEDVDTTVCTPMLVPDSPFAPIPGNPDITAIGGIPCTGRDTGACIRLAEEAQDQGLQPVPRSTISASPKD